MISLHAEASALTVTEGLDDTALVSGMANVASVQVTFSEDWDGLDKVLVFTDGIRTIIHELTQDDEIVPVPHELMAEPGKTLYVGVQGTDGERVILPTVMCRLKAVAWGADPDGDESTLPPKPYWQEVLGTMGRMVAAAAAEADRAEKSASGSKIFACDILDEDGQLYVTVMDTADEEFIFEIDEESGELEVIVA